MCAAIAFLHRLAMHAAHHGAERPAASIDGTERRRMENEGVHTQCTNGQGAETR